jgi:hypothetical protein
MALMLLVLVEVFLFDFYRFSFLIYDENIYKYIHIIGGSSYIGGCDEAYPITYLPGVTGITGVSTYVHDGDVTGTKSTFTLPGGSSRTDYLHDGEVNSAKSTQTLPGGSTRTDYLHDGEVNSTKSTQTLPGVSTRTDYLHGFTVIKSAQTLPGGSTRRDYIPGVGVGNVGKYATLQSPGGNGAIVLTFKVNVK